MMRVDLVVKKHSCFSQNPRAAGPTATLAECSHLGQLQIEVETRERGERKEGERVVNLYNLETRSGWHT